MGNQNSVTAAAAAAVAATQRTPRASNGCGSAGTLAVHQTVPLPQQSPSPRMGGGWLRCAQAAWWYGTSSAAIGPISCRKLSAYTINLSFLTPSSAHSSRPTAAPWQCLMAEWCCTACRDSWGKRLGTAPFGGTLRSASQMAARQEESLSGKLGVSW